MTVANSETRLKYRIKETFIRVFGSEAAVKKAKLNMSEAENISEASINYHMNLLMSDTSEIKDVQLQKYARFLGVSISYLKED